MRLLVKAGLLAPPRRGGDSFIDFYNEVAAQEMNTPLILLLNESYMYLLVQGIIIPKPTPPNYGSYEAWSYYVLTQYGKDWACGEVKPILEDTDGFVAYLKSMVPALDDVVLQYISEAVHARDRGLSFASAVMVGAASEKLFYLFAEATVRAIQDPALQKKLLKLINGTRALGQLREKIKDVLEQNIKSDKIPYSIHKDSLDSILSLFTAIRIQRNDAVHPTAGAVDPAQLRLLLLSFPHVCRKVYDFIAWLNENQL